MQDLRNLYNQALTAVGSEPVVTDPEAPTRATAILNLWYPVARHAVLTASHWGSVRRVARLALTSTRNADVDWANTDPAPGYAYAHALPSDMLLPQYLADFSRFQLGRNGAETLLFSNNPSPILYYTMDDPEPSAWEPDLYRCVIWALAASVNTAKSGKMAVTQKLEQQVLDLISNASTALANQQDTYFEGLPSFYINTGFSPPMQAERFYYPTNTYRISV